MLRSRYLNTKKSINAENNKCLEYIFQYYLVFDITLSYLVQTRHNAGRHSCLYLNQFIHLPTSPSILVFQEGRYKECLDYVKNAGFPTEEADRHAKARKEILDRVKQLKEDLFYQQCSSEAIQSRVTGISIHVLKTSPFCSAHISCGLERPLMD